LSRSPCVKLIPSWGFLGRFTVCKSGVILALLTLTARVAQAQQELPPSTDDGPMHIQQARPLPDKDGVYAVVPGIISPIVLDRVAATYPADASSAEINGFSQLSFVVDVNGTASGIEVQQSHGPAFDAASIDAIKQTKFQPGNLDGKPVPVRIYARVRFFDDQRPAYPRIINRIAPTGGFAQSPGGNRFPLRPYDTPPVATYTPVAEYSEQARKAKFNGVVIVSVLVNEDGVPIDPKITRPVGMGLDEKAIETVLKYRFRPAMKDGAPVEAHIAIEVNFRLY
jgi:TonB family protein